MWFVVKIYRIHGDNIVECERVTNIIINALHSVEIQRKFVSPSTLLIELKAFFDIHPINWILILLPGFNKNTKKRWQGNIFSALQDAGSLFDETPDIIISELDNFGTEKILMGIEFCSALQAGNQAWQRSARAFSTGRTGCPYLYVVDFVKYELDATTRKRKALRFPNAAIPYSYINYSKNINNFVAQLYVKSEEFNKLNDVTIENFNDSDFAEQDLGIYIVKLMLGLNTFSEQERILNKNLNVVKFLAQHANENINFSASEWEGIYKKHFNNIVDYAVENVRFNFRKIIASKSRHGKSEEFVNLVAKLSVGFASRELPFGIIPANKRAEFAQKLHELYPYENGSAINFIAHNKKHLIVYNKSDLCPDTPPDGIAVSAKTGHNVDLILKTIVEMVTNTAPVGNMINLTNERQTNLLRKAYDLLNTINPHEPLDKISANITLALSYIGKITGTDVDERTLDEIFSKFCLGK